MKNVEFSVDGNMLTIKIDLSKEFGPSSSGKNIQRNLVLLRRGRTSLSHQRKETSLFQIAKKRLA